MRNLCPQGDTGVYMGTQSSRLQVSTPYNPEWVVFCHAHHGRYRKRSRIWSFPRHAYPKVAAKLNELFGTTLEYNGDGEGEKEKEGA